ncbi:uncharacterized protein LOC103848027 [Brassica rapa]|uniref:uncharacterized protein LOC103848027 n=1 Tax=Brassica campestris TaxID=3711 RepID=UPI000BBF051A|nr:uncharacterized protein LOC103848027 [Brassica rapa]
MHISDVIGQVISLRDVQSVQVSGKDKKRVEFRLLETNGQSMACCLWGKYAEQLEEHLQKSNYPNMVCLIRFAKIGFYKGDVKVTNAFDASLIQFNPEFPETLALKLSCKSKALILKSKEGGILFSNEKPLFWCTSCHATVTSVAPKYKLHMFVKDDTSTCKLMMLDSVRKLIVGCEAEELWDGSYDEIEDPTYLPQPIRDLVGKSLCFGVTLSSENVANGSDVFLVSQVCSGDKILQIESNSDPMTHVMDGSSITSGGEVYVSEKNSQNSSEGTSTPFSKHKEKDQLDQNSTSKKICSKSVKMEKIKDD